MTVESRIRTIAGVVDVRYLDPELKQQIRHYETVAESHGAAGGLMPYKNRGVWEVLARDVSVVLICEKDLGLLTDGEGMVCMMDKAGQVLGEYVAPARKEKVQAEHPNAFFLSDDFVMYPDRRADGEPYFLIDEVPVHDLDDIEGIARVTSGSMTTLSDDIVRGLHGFHRPEKVDAPDRFRYAVLKRGWCQARHRTAGRRAGRPARSAASALSSPGQQCRLPDTG